MATVVASSANADGARRRFLVLHDSHSALPANMAMTAGMTAVFEGELPGGYDIYAEYRDGERFADSEQDRRFAEEISLKYGDLPLDAVIALGPGSLAFAASNAALFARDAPVIFGAVMQDQVGRLDLPSNFSGVTADFDLAGTLQLARMLQPDATKVVVLSGSAPFDRQWRAAAHELLAGIRDIRVDHVSGLTIDGFERFAADVAADTILIILSIFEDSAGERLLPRDSAARIAARASAPVYGV